MVMDYALMFNGLTELMVVTIEPSIIETNFNGEKPWMQTIYQKLFGQMSCG